VVVKEVDEVAQGIEVEQAKVQAVAADREDHN
jgi:hypothetical protein